MDSLTFAKAISILTEKFPIQAWSVKYTPFEILVSTILSQNTSDAVSIRGFERLRKRFEVTPQVIANASLGEIRECLKPAGLYNQKAVRIQQIARIILERYVGDFDAILRLPLEEARKRLLELSGVGEKTADVVLNFCAGRGTFPVDTHIARIAKKWGLVSQRASYGHIKERFEELVPEDRRREAHLLLIKFGRNVCRARQPKCGSCPIRRYCPQAEGMPLDVLPG